MLTRVPAWTLAFAAAVFSPAFTSAQPGVSQDGSPAVETHDARHWLKRIHDAPTRHNFQGTVVVSAGGTAASSRLTHFSEGRNQYERIDSLDGQMRHIFRHNDVVHTVWPKSRVVMVEQRDAVTSFPALLQSNGDRVLEFYDVKVHAEERVAGREAHVLLLTPKDSLRYGYRLWADSDSGLLLRSEVLNDRNEVLESSSFSDINIGIRTQPDLVVQPMRRVDGYRVLRPTLAATSLEAEGWKLQVNVPGFTLVSCNKRPFEGPNVEQGSVSDMLQTVYSDGITYVTLFIEPYNAGRHTRTLAAAIGATQTLMKRYGDWWVTVMGDVPATTLRQFAAGLERRH